LIRRVAIYSSETQQTELETKEIARIFEARGASVEIILPTDVASFEKCTEMIAMTFCGLSAMVIDGGTRLNLQPLF
jgi:hypothetical protein